MLLPTLSCVAGDETCSAMGMLWLCPPDDLSTALVICSYFEYTY